MRLMLFNEEQIQIAKLVQNGFTNIEIGEELGYSADCIKKRLSKLYKKIGVKKRIEFVKWLANNPV